MTEESPNILIIDENEQVCNYLRKLLVNEEFTVTCVSDEESAMDEVRTGGYDLILLDISLNEDKGMAMIGAIGKYTRDRILPVVLLSSLSEEDRLIEGLDLGAMDYVIKPVNAKVLVARIKNQLRMRQIELELKMGMIALQKEISRRETVEQELRARERELERYVWIDGLTGVCNRRKFDEYLDFQYRQKIRAKEPISLVMCDIDFFKQYNDTYGHQQGDHCLIDVAEILSGACRRSDDLACRYGGEEFCLILPNTPTEGALAIAETIQKALAQKAIPHEKSSIGDYLTMSIGVSTIIPHKDGEMAELLRVADENLYKAKSSGRNQIVS